LLEIGWQPIGSSSRAGCDSPSAYWVTLPEGVGLAPKIVELTGIQEDDFKTALPPEQAWHKVVEAADRLPVSPVEPRKVVLIHYARFERPFLRHLHNQYGDGGAWPFRVICTHNIARRLLPDLPRCGLCALAGYFGHTLSPRNRAASHTIATRVIWAHLLPLLAAEGIREWSDLMQWLDRPQPSRRMRNRMRKKWPMPRALRLAVPDAPGVYRMRRSNGDLLYVGKARSLKRRVNSYFQTHRRHPEHILEMLTQAQDLECMPTPTALEAALWEADCIKQTAPPYNICLKPRETVPVFFTDDFQLAGVPDRPHYTVGPLPSERTLAAFRFIVAQCGRSTATLPADTEELAVAIDIPVRCLPPITAFADGLNVYRTICACRGDLRRTARQLLKRGRLLWRRRKHQATVDDDQAAPQISDAREWTTDAVVEMLDGIVRQGSHLVRRGRWLQIVANATLSWDTPRRTTASERTLYIREGRIYPAPNGAARKGANQPTTVTPSRSAARQIFTSDTTYDRLRVLTTELRRLLAEERRIVFSPAVGGSVGSRGLARLLSLI
jgi:DNA polymerase-3 subunit epsilon